MATAKELVAKAASQIGVAENPPDSNKVKYWDYYKQHCGKNYNGSPWCAAFVTWCMSEIGAWKFTSDEGRFRYCPSLVAWAKEKGQWLDRDAKPKPGDIILFANGTRACHVGIVESRPNSSSVITIEGNTSTSSNDNGGKVMRRTRTYGKVGSSWYILGFVRTPWDGWVETDKGWWYRNSDGSYPTNKWEKIDGDWYYFNDEGYALSNRWKKLKNFWYWFNEDCRMAKGWKKLKGLWYYLNVEKIKEKDIPEGAARTGWIKLKGLWYYLNTANDKGTECAARTGWFEYRKDEWYYLNKEGEGTECAMRTGWLKWKNNWYYLQPNKPGKEGMMAINETLTIDGKSYTFDGTGKML